MRVIVLLFSTFLFFQSFAQVIGSHDNSDIVPTEAKASTLSTGMVSGDVNLFTGDYSTSISLGNVSTPGGLSFDLNLSYSSTYVEGTSPSVAAGIPYGEGWNLSIPSISVSNAAYFSFLQSFECYVKRANELDENYYSLNEGITNGDLYWYSPTVNIPGYASGKAIFKYLENNSQTAVFVLNKFDKYIELRFDGQFWQVILDNGDIYRFEAAIRTYRNPNNERIFNYDTESLSIKNDVQDLIGQDKYIGSQKKAIRNIIEPKAEYTTWYCTGIYNKNKEHQTISFEYEKFGEFNFFQEYNQHELAEQIGNKLLDLTFPEGGFSEDFNVYRDLLLKRVVSYSLLSAVDILDLEYATAPAYLFGSNMLNHLSDTSIIRKDSLYSSKTIYSQGIEDHSTFNSEWNRYLHGKSGSHVLSSQRSIDSYDPYVVDNNKYLREIGQGGGNSIPFNHGFLETPRFSASDLISGDTYEIRTKVIDMNGNSASQGNGTLDISVVTGNCGANPTVSNHQTSGSYLSNNVNINGSNEYFKSDYDITRGEQIYSTFNNAIKWQLHTDSTSMKTSNFFVMPNLPTTNRGANIQIGPGNSAHNHNKSHNLGSGSFPIAIDQNSNIPSAYNGYAHRTVNSIKPYAKINSNFGVGMPWAMVLPLYTASMGGLQIDSVQSTSYSKAIIDVIYYKLGNDTIFRGSDLTMTLDSIDTVSIGGLVIERGLNVWNKIINGTKVHSNPHKSSFANFWWNDTDDNTSPNWANTPTKFNNSVRLEEFELIRYSKNPYMLSNVKKYKINGESSPNNDDEKILIHHYSLAYDMNSQDLYENYNYQDFGSQTDNLGDVNSNGYIHYQTKRAQPVMSSGTHLKQNVYTLETVKQLPVGHYNETTHSNLGSVDTLETNFKYEWFGGDVEPEVRVNINDIDSIVVMDSVWQNPGRQGRLLKAIIDPLGGETELIYYPRTNAETLHNSVGNNKPKGCAILYDNASYAVSQAAVIHPSIKTISKNGNISTPASILTSSLLKKRTDYFYDTTKIISETEDLHLPENFRNAYRYDYQKGFQNTTVVNSELISGERNYSINYFGGNVNTTYYDKTTQQTITDHSTLDEYLYFGKLLKTENYNSQSILESSTEWTYNNTLAHKNALERATIYRDNFANPHAHFERFSGTSAGYHDYEYRDYYRSDIPEDTLIMQGAIHPKFGNHHKKSGYLIPFFYDDLRILNPEWRLHSYFVKLASKSKKIYDLTCTKNQNINTGTTTVILSVSDSPFGVEPNNPKPSVPGLDNDLILMISETADYGNDIKDSVIGLSPLSDYVIDTLLKKIDLLSNSVLYSIMHHQNPLKDTFLIKIFENDQNLMPDQVIELFKNQPYITDHVQKYVVDHFELSQNEILINILNHNTYLSDQVLETMYNKEGFPEFVTNEVLIHQPQLSMATINNLLENSSEVEAFNIVDILTTQAYLTDSVFIKVLDNEGLTDHEKAVIVSQSESYPSSDDIINDYLDLDLSEAEVLAIGTASPRVFPSSISDQFYDLLSLSASDQTLQLSQAALNGYERFCINPTVCSNDYIETVENYTYFEADYDGGTLAEGYKKLMGLEDVETRTVSSNRSKLENDITLSKIRLKHEPSWQLHSVKTHSPDYDSAFTQKEYYYYFDELNRHDRHIEYYDVENNFSIEFDVDSNLVYDTIIRYYDYGDFISNEILYGQVPLSDGGRCSQRNLLRNIPFQETNISKNVSDSSPISKSTYYHYDTKIHRGGNYFGRIIRDFNGPICDSTAPPNCNEYIINYVSHAYTVNDAQVLIDLPVGYCAYEIDVHGGPINFVKSGFDFSTCPTMQSAYDTIRLIGCNDGTSSGTGDSLSPQGYIDLTARYRGNQISLKDVIVQIDTISNTSYNWNLRLDKSNDYIAFFKVSGQDEHGLWVDEMVFPFDTMAIRTIDSLNHNDQVALEHNQSGIYTKYNYDFPAQILNVNSNGTGACSGFGNYYTDINSNIGVPTSIVVGYGRTDYLQTDYEYYPNYRLKSITNPNQIKIEYQYDDYGRLYEAHENNRLLTRNNYHYWNRDTNDNYMNRSNQNYVESYAFNDTILTPNTYNGIHSKSFIDIYGREIQTVSAVSGDHSVLTSPTTVFDNWNRPLKTFKPVVEHTANVNPMDLTFDATGPYQEMVYENNTKARLKRSAAFGIHQVYNNHTVKQSHSIINDIALLCELSLSAEDMEWFIGSSLEKNLKFYRQEIKDEDDKAMTTYTNPLGQKVATLQYGKNLNDDIVTLFGYDSYGNLNRVVNPKKQTSRYDYNILGQLYKQTTTDAGETKYMYNRLGKVAIKQTQNNKIERSFELEADSVPSFTKYTYDSYGRVIEQSIVSKGTYDGQNYYSYPSLDLIFYQDSAANIDINGGPIPNNGNTKDYFNYKFSNKSTYYWLADVNVYKIPSNPMSVEDTSNVPIRNLFDNQNIQKKWTYGHNNYGYTLGKLNKMIDYDANGKIIQVVNLTYDVNGNLYSETTEFNPTGKSSLNTPYYDSTKTVKSQIIYADYNYQRALRRKDIDINNDGTIDFQYHHHYDEWGHLDSVYFNFRDNPHDKALVASYGYDLSTGLDTIMHHYYTDICEYSTNLNATVQIIKKQYDVRNRLINQNSFSLDYTLYYDNQSPGSEEYQSVASSQNWNGNINGMRIYYGTNLVINANNFSTTFSDTTLYGYEYDLLNRLTKADAIVGDFVKNSGWNTDSYGAGDVFYQFDKIGNFTNLQREKVDELNANVFLTDTWYYQYKTGTNQLETAFGSGNATNRQYTYDTNGNLTSDDFRELNAVKYYRDNFPVQIDKPNQTIHYLYGNDDIRNYKKVVENGTENISNEEYYLKDIGIYDMKNEQWTYYVNGLARVAKIKPNPEQTPHYVDSTSNHTIEDVKNFDINFYLTDYLGNTRIVYQPTITCGSNVVDNTNLYIADYYPYGKILREYVSNGDREKFLTTQHERDDETGLDYRGARFYDSDIGRFLSLDPLAASYPGWSDYSYVMGNPVSFIDPTGMAVEDHYSMDRNGNTKLEKKTDDDFDMIYTKKDYESGDLSNGTKINDKSILSQLVGNKNEFYGGSYATSSNKSEMFKVFKFAADNANNVEWAISAYRTKSGNEYNVRTSHHPSSVTSASNLDRYNDLNLVFNIHSHPGQVNDGGTKGASGNEFYGGDMRGIASRYNRFKKAGMQNTNTWFKSEAGNTVFPKHYVYHVNSNTLYHYTPWQKSIFIRKANNANGLHRGLGF